MKSDLPRLMRARNLDALVIFGSDGFLGRWQYAISPHNTLTTKLTGLRWRECSICEMFFNWSTIVSTITRLRSKSLSSSGSSVFFMLARMLVINGCIHQ